MPKITNNQRLYGNWVMLAPDGTELCLCNERKFKWYTSRGLAQQLGDSKQFQLTFWPKGKGHAESNPEYYLGEKKNVCVVCGTSENLTKHHVVPSFYRKHFPHEFKSRASHDLVLICIKDHFDYENNHAMYLTRQIAEELGVLVEAGVVNPSPKKKKQASLAHALLTNEKIPNKRVAEITALLVKLIGYIPTDDQLADIAMNHALRSRKVIDKSHGFLVAKLLTEQGTIQEFMRRWRRHFVEHAQPQHLPHGWNTEL
jgi:hypothetical protein